MNELLEVWNNLSYFDGIMFIIFVGIMYYGKRYIDFQFDKKLSDYNK